MRREEFCAVRRRELCGFYENELKANFLSYWLPRCEDRENGGFVNCFTNDGRTLVSRDKYTWSQGRFIWMFAKLAGTDVPVFSAAERAEFLRLARQGTEFLMRHVLLPGKEMRCIFVMEADGTHKLAPGCDAPDASIYADCFAAAGIARYALTAGDAACYAFARDLYRSIVRRVESGNFYTLPYPLRKDLMAHGVPMILENVAAEMHLAAERLAPEDAAGYREDLARFTSKVLDVFTDENCLVREVMHADGTFLDALLGRHINPGHTIEDVWFMLDSAAITGETWRREKIFRVAKKALETGWDGPFGGILHFAGLKGGKPAGSNAGCEDEPMSAQLAGWDHKLWWVHSEALYSSLRCFLESGDPDFLDWHDRVFAYVYDTFPQTDPEIREWIQIRDRAGAPIEKVVALPVKDPYHVIRNLILIIELLRSYA